MSDTSTQTAETTTEWKPPTLANIVREKTDDGRRIIDFFLDVMEDKIDGAELCHRMDAARQLEKHKSKAAAKFLAKYRGVSCGHSTGGRPNPAAPCFGEDATRRENAPAPFTQDLLTVLSAVDEDLMARLVRAQTADGSTVIEFLDDVMQDRNDGFRPHHRIAAAKELIVHIVRDEQPDPLPSEASASVSAEAPSSVRAEPGQIVVPAESLPRTRYGAGTHPRPHQTVTMGKPAPEQPGADTQPSNPEPVEGSQLETKNSKLETLSEPAEGTQDYRVRRPRRLRTRTQRRRDGAARAATLGKPSGSERNEEEKQDKPTPAERRIKERLEQHWHEPGPWAGPIDSTTPGRSPPW